MSMEIPEIEHYYPLEKISLISSKLDGFKVELLNDFMEFYDNLEVKIPDVNSFRRHNRNKNYNNGKNCWRKKSRFRVKDIEKFLVNSYKRQLPDNDNDKIRRTIISHLNKLNAKKFTIIVKDFIDNLEELMYSETYELLNKEIMEKVLGDLHYGTLYAKLVKELIINKKWQKKMFNIIQNEEGQFYWSLNVLKEEESEFIGPFGTNDEAIEDAMEQHNFKISFCGYLENEFKTRDKYTKEIKDTESQFDMNIYLKNRYNNFLKFILSCVEVKIFNLKVLHHTLLGLIGTNELEPFAHLFDNMQKSRCKVDTVNLNFYEEEVNKVISKNTLSPKTKYKLMEFFKLNIPSTNTFDILAELSSPENTENEPKNTRTDQDRTIDCIISEYPINNNYDEVRRQFDCISDYDLFYNKIIEVILEGKETQREILMELLGKLWKNFVEFAESFLGFVDKNLIELYGEYQIDYPNCSEIFIKMIRENMEILDKNYVDVLMGKSSEDEEESYNIELFNKHILENLKC
jgi:hypothetical protein